MPTEPKHTKGELRVNKNESFKDVILGPDYVVAKCDMQFTGKEEAEANAARLVAGWNLLNRLEEMGVRLDWLEKNLEDIAAQQSRDDMALTKKG